MAKINLRDFYPWYSHDEFAEVPNEVAAELLTGRRYEKTQERVKRRYNVHSLDAEDGTAESASVNRCYNPEQMLSMMEWQCRLCRALNTLPEIQGRRVEAHYLLGKSRKEIENAERVSESAVNQSIERGLIAMRKNYFKNFSKLPCQNPEFCPDI
jgi:RNA polymerase sigma-70 factor (ECF subfamily)